MCQHEDHSTGSHYYLQEIKNWDHSFRFTLSRTGEGGGGGKSARTCFSYDFS